MYSVQGHIIHHTTDTHGVSIEVRYGIPTFFLNETVQGIVDEKHAEVIAREIICPVDLQYEGIEVHVTAVKV